jgi:hypothetical protein
MQMFLHGMQIVRGIRAKAALVVAALILALTAAAPARSYTIWRGPLDFVPATSGLTAVPGIPSASIRFQGSVSTLHWGYLSLSLPSDVEVDSVTVCYELSNPASFLSQTRIVRMSTPDTSPIVVDDGTDRTAALGCYTVNTFGLEVDQSFSLALRFEISDPSHYIEVGAVGIHVSPTMTSVGGGSYETSSPERRAALDQNRPNPFNPETTIDFRVREEGHVGLAVFDAEGRRVRTLVDETRSAGEHQARWDGRADDGREVASGTYFYRLTVEGDAEVRKMVVLQ